MTAYALLPLQRKPWKDVKHCFHSEDAFENIERLRLVVPGRVKVTAYEEADGEHPPARNHCDLLIYPESECMRIMRQETVVLHFMTPAVFMLSL